MTDATQLRMPRAVARPPLRERAFPQIWAAVWPLRQYLRYWPSSRGKGLLQRQLLLPLLPPNSDFVATLPGGGRIRLRYRETLGLSTLLRGGFETAEALTMRRWATPGTVAIDVGANVGLHTVPLSQAVGWTGRVFAFEPLPANVERLKANLEMNRLSNVEVHPVALGRADGIVALHLSDDAAYCSTVSVAGGRANGATAAVPIARLDTIWRSAGRPRVSVLKVDIEGDEFAVLEGSRDLLAKCRPALLLEANGEEALQRLASHLAGLGYRLEQPQGFMRWNYLFLAERGRP